LVEFGLKILNIKKGVPWSFDYNGHPITHENDQCYLIPTLEGIRKFTPDDMLITGTNGDIWPCKKDVFEANYEKHTELCVTVSDKSTCISYITDKDKQDLDIKAIKQLRQDGDALIQRVKELGQSREKSLVITKLQEGVMWLGMELKRLGEANPYPNSKDPSNTKIEPTADGLKL
jgi:hypothetical protein